MAPEAKSVGEDQADVSSHGAPISSFGALTCEDVWRRLEATDRADEEFA